MNHGNQENSVFLVAGPKMEFQEIPNLFYSEYIFKHSVKISFEMDQPSMRNHNITAKYQDGTEKSQCIC